MKTKQLSLFSILFASVLLAPLLLAGVRAPVVNALPPRPTAVPTRQQPPPPLRGGIIELHIEGQVIEGIWTVVQWQDMQGDWHDVTGWQGTLDEGNIKTWWVGEEDLETGPFRWRVMLDAAVLGTSDLFYLPARPGEKITVTISTAD